MLTAGPERTVNVMTAAIDNTPAIAALTGSRMVVVWETDDSSGRGIRGQLVDGFGNLIGGEFLVNTVTAGNQSDPTITALADGRFVVSWWDSSGQGGDTSPPGIKAQIFDGTGAKVGGEFLVNTATFSSQYQPHLAALAGGGFLAVWQDYSGVGGDWSSSGIKAQRFDSSGNKVGGELLVNSSFFDGQQHPAAIGLASGGFIVTWTDNIGDGSDYGIKAQRFDSAGGMIGGEFLVNTVTFDRQVLPEVAALSNGNIVITWQDQSGQGGDPSGLGVKAQLLDGLGNKIGGEFLVNSSTLDHQTEPRIASLPNGGFIIGWTDWSGQGGDSSQSGIKAQVFDGSGNRVGAEFLVNVSTFNAQFQADLTALDDGSFAVTWAHTGAGIKLRLFSFGDRPVNDVGGPAVGNEDSFIPLTGISVSDPASNPAIDEITMHLSVEHGTLTIRTDVAGGINAADITGGGNGTNGITLTATQNQINATLAAAGGLNYLGDPDFHGSDGLTVSSYNGIFSDPPTLAPVATSGALVNPSYLVNADVNGDGFLDLAYAGSTAPFVDTNRVGIRLGDGAGNFAPTTSYLSGGRPSQVIPTDLDDDGDVDLIVSNYGSGAGAADGVVVLLNDGAGNFGPHQLIANLPQAYDLLVDDFNGDGRSDLAVAQDSLGTVSVMLASGPAGSFAAPVTYTANSVFQRTVALVAGDFNGDGRSDLIVINFDNSDTSSGEVSILINNGDGTFGAPVHIAVGLRQPFDGEAGDLDGDGNLDLVYATHGAAAPQGLHVRLGNGDGTFQPATFYATASFPIGVSIGDLNGDGRPDLVSGTGLGGNLAVFVGNGDGSFRPRADFATGSYFAERATLGDFDGDGDSDVAINRGHVDGQGVFINTTASRGDVDVKPITVNDVPEVNVINGTEGDDTLFGTPGDDEINGFGGNDTITPRAGDDVVNGGDGNDSIHGQQGDDQLTGGAGHDFFRGGTGNDVIDGGAGFDRVSHFQTGNDVLPATGVTVSLLLQGVPQDTGHGLDTLIGIEALSGTAFDDVLTGDNANNWLWTSHDGFGFTGNDQLFGNGGHDLIQASPGDHFLHGGGGVDTLSFWDNGTGASAPGVTASLALQGLPGSPTTQDTGIGTMTIHQFENLSGTQFDDALTGDGGGNILAGYIGNDALAGGGGDDTLLGDGWIGFDANGLSLPGTVFGPGEGVIVTVFDVTETYGDPGGDDVLDGGDGNDMLVGGSGDDLLIGGAGSDTLDGGAGMDTASWADSGGGIILRLHVPEPHAETPTGADEVSGIETFIGSEFDDLMIGDNNDNRFFGMAGNDQLVGNGGNDMLDGGAGNDNLAGHGGHDTLAGGDGHDGLAGFQGNDNLSGGDGNDFFRGGSGDDVIDGGAGFDRVSHFGNPGDPVTNGVTVSLLIAGPQDTGQGMDTYIGVESLSGTQFDDTLIGDHGVNWLIGGAIGGNDNLFGEGGDDLLEASDDGAHLTVDGGAGSDTVSFLGLGTTSAAVNASLLLQGSMQDVGAFSVTLSNVENLTGTQFGDSLTGDGSDNVLGGHDGDDTLVGGAGDDELHGDGAMLANGAAIMAQAAPPEFFAELGFAGNDLLEGGLGNDALFGGAGIDTASYAGNGGPVDVNLGAGFADEYAADGITLLSTDTLSGIENVTGSEHDDSLVGDANANVLRGLGGGDIILGGAGSDTLEGGDGNDALRGELGAGYSGPGGNDTLIGGAGHDYLNGGQGADSYDGGDGFDRVSFYANAATQGVVANLATGVVSNDGFGNVESIVNVEALGVGTVFSDTFIGDDNGNHLWGGHDVDQSAADSLFGGGGDDLLQVFPGDHTLDGGTGIDTLSLFDNGTGLTSAGASVSLLLQGAAQDTRQGMMVLSGFENISGTTFDDQLTGDGNANTLAGDQGSDHLIGGDGNDRLLGDGSIGTIGQTGSGGPVTTVDDVNAAFGQPGGDDLLEGGLGNDELIGGAGIDTASYANANGGVSVDLRFGAASGADGDDSLSGIENVTGSEFDDVIIGDGNDNHLSGLGGVDNLVGRGGGDTLDGGDGDDFLLGDGNFLYTGPSGNDVLLGGGGNDVMRGGAGTDSFDGGDGFDRVSFFSAAATQGAVASLVTQTISNDGYGNVETLAGMEGLGGGTAFADHFTGDDNANELLGDAGDTLIGNGGDDSFFVTGATLIDGGDGDDTAEFFSRERLVPDTSGDGLAETVTTTFGVNVDLRFNAIHDDGFGNSGTIQNVENVTGSELDDQIFGDGNANVLTGHGGNDTLFGFGGSDTFHGGDGDDVMRGEGNYRYNGAGGNDVFFGGDGDDYMNGMQGVDSYDGGAGFDRISFYNAAATQGAVASLISQSIANDGFGNSETMVSVEGLGSGTAFADHFTGDDNANDLFGSIGDTIIANGGDDTFQLEGGPALLDGGDGIDTINAFVRFTIAPDSNGDGLAEDVETSVGVVIDLRFNALVDDGFGNSGTIVNVENVGGSELDDQIFGDGNANVIIGRGGADFLVGFGGGDTVDGGDGDDIVFGDGGFSYNGPSGNDTLRGGGGDDLLRGGAGVDSHDGGAGRDRVTFFNIAATQAAVANLITQTISNDGYGNAETMTGIEGLGGGTAFADHFTGDDNDNDIFGATGDTLLANGGNDYMLLGGAPALTDGGAGVDTVEFTGDTIGNLTPDVTGDGLAELVFATSGVVVDLRFNAINDDGFGNSGTIMNVENVIGSELDDILFGDHNANVLTGRGGSDILFGFGGGDTLDGGDGDDQLRGDGGNAYTGPSGNDTLIGGAGNDFMNGGAGVDSFDGGAGFDRISFFNRAATQGAIASLLAQTITNDGYGNAEIMTGVEGLGGGTAFADHFTGDDNANDLFGSIGDTIIANGGDDNLLLTGAAALVDGGAGVDTAEFDTNTGGTLVPDGPDPDSLADLVFATSGVVVDLRFNAIHDDGFGNSGTIQNVENVTGSELDDQIFGDGNANVILGRGGADFLFGFGGGDTLDGGDGDDILRGDGRVFYNGPSGDDTLLGGAGDDYMNGGAGTDSYDGGDGFDRISFYAYAATQGAVANLITQTIANDGFGNAETMVSVEALGAGTAFADHFTGDDNANLLIGSNGDTIIANGGDDSFQLDAAPALLDGGDGVDTINVFLRDRLIPDANGDGLAEDDSTTEGVHVDLGINAVVDDGFGGSGAIVNVENVGGSQYDDTLIGDGSANILSGFEGADFLHGAGGDDTLAGGEGDDTLDGGTGNDALDGGAGIDTVSYAGAAGPVEVHLGGGWANELDADFNPVSQDSLVDVERAIGSAFDDFLSGSGGNNMLFGGGGDDELVGHLGDDHLDGGSGTDFANYGGAAGGVVVNLLAGTASGDGNDTLESIEQLGGSQFGDHLIGDGNNNLILGRGGADLIEGGDGHDHLQGNQGNDSVYGGAGNDLLRGQDGDDMIDGGDGFDRYSDFAGATSGVTISLLLQGAPQDTGRGMDTLMNIEALSGTPFDDHLTGDHGVNWFLVVGGGTDTVFGEGGDDLVEVGPGNHMLDGGAGNDSLSLSGNTTDIDTDGVTVSLLLQGAAQDTEQGMMTISGFENLSGSIHDDSLTGDGAANVLAGDEGSDNLVGGAGDDILLGDGQIRADVPAGAGTAGPPAIFNEATDLNGPGHGDDLLEGGLGNDTLIGGGGIDTASYANATGPVEVNLGAGFADEYDPTGNTVVSTDTLSGIENATGSQFDDALVGDANANTLRGLGGNDFILGGNGGDTLEGGNGHDHLQGQQGNDIVRGGAGNDLLRGQDGDDLIDGGDGFDRFSDFAGATTGVTISLLIAGPQDTGHGMDTFVGIEALSGTPFDDHLTGDHGVNWFLAAGGGNETVSGEGGDDLIEVGAGNHNLTGGLGIDTASFRGNTLFIDSDGVTVSLLLQGAAQDTEQGLMSLAGFENLSGSIHDDSLTGDNSDNLLAGDEGSDILVGGGGNDTLLGDGHVIADVPAGAGTAGPPAIFDETTEIVGPGHGNDLLEGGLGNDTLIGGGGVDTASYANAGGAVDVHLGAGLADEYDGAGLYLSTDTLSGIENVIGSAYDDAIVGDVNANLLRGLGGNDLLFGFGGDDLIEGGGGRDNLRGYDGNDILLGGDSHDLLRGGNGDDTIDGGAGFDRASFTGTPGEALPATGVTVSLLLQGVAQNTGHGWDILTGIEALNGTAFDDHLTGDHGENWLLVTAGNDTVLGEGGDDLIMLANGNHFADGGLGLDTVAFASGFETAGVTVSLTLQGSAQATGIGTMTLSGFENLSGSAFDDILTGDAADNLVAGNVGADTLSGGNGNDRLYGDGGMTIDFPPGVGTSGPIAFFANLGAGNDVLDGGDGTDILNGGGGDDVLTGGKDVDRFEFGDASGHDRITDFDKTEVIAIDAAGVDDLSDLTIIQVGKDTLVSWDGGAASVLVENIKASKLTAANFELGGASAAFAPLAFDLSSDPLAWPDQFNPA